MNLYTDIELNTDLGVLYNKAQANNVLAEVMRCRDVGMDVSVFDKPYYTEVSVKRAYNSHGTCYGLDYIFSAQSIKYIREIYEEGYDISNLLKLRISEHLEKPTTVPVFGEDDIAAIYQVVSDNYDPERYMELCVDHEGKETGWPVFMNSREIEAVHLAYFHKLDADMLLEIDATSKYFKHYKHHPGTMRLINQAVARGLPSAEYIVKSKDNGYAFDPMCFDLLNYACIAVPHCFEFITRMKSGEALYDYRQIFYIVKAFEQDIPSKFKLIELKEDGYPKYTDEEMRKILTSEYDGKIDK